jgi:hypothetical protein
MDRASAYGSAGNSIILEQLIEEYTRSDQSLLPQSHFNFWLEHLGATTRLLNITPAHVAAGIEKSASLPAVRYMGKAGNRHIWAHVNRSPSIATESRWVYC